MRIHIFLHDVKIVVKHFPQLDDFNRPDARALQMWFPKMRLTKSNIKKHAPRPENPYYLIHFWFTVLDNLRWGIPYVTLLAHQGIHRSFINRNVKGWILKWQAPDVSLYPCHSWACWRMLRLHSIDDNLREIDVDDVKESSIVHILREIFQGDTIQRSSTEKCPGQTSSSNEVFLELPQPNMHMRALLGTNSVIRSDKSS